MYVCVYVLMRWASIAPYAEGDDGLDMDTPSTNTLVKNKSSEIISRSNDHFFSSSSCLFRKSGQQDHSVSRATYSHTDTSEEKEEDDDDEEEEGDDENDKELLENVFIGLANGKSYVNFKDLMDWDFVLDLFYEVRFILELV